MVGGVWWMVDGGWWMVGGGWWRVDGGWWVVAPRAGALAPPRPSARAGELRPAGALGVAGFFLARGD